MRQDFRIMNDGRSFSVLTADRVQTFADSDDLSAVVAEQKAIAVYLGADDYFTGRLVVNENLTELETSEWIARIRRPLCVTNDGIVIAGGCDSDSFISCLEEKPDKTPEDYSYVVPFEVPVGNYCVDIYAYTGSYAADDLTINDLEDDEPYKTYATRWSNGPFPLEIYEDAEELAESIDYAAQMIELVKNSGVEVVNFGEDNELVVTYLFHFHESSATGADWTINEPKEDGWISFDNNTRVPDSCPKIVPTILPES